MLKNLKLARVPAFEALVLGAAAATFAVGVSGCAGASDTPQSTDAPEPVGAEQEAYSDAECSTANPDVTATIGSLLYTYQNGSPTTYSNPKSYKSYIWDLTYKAGPANAYTTIGLGLPASSFANQADCQGVTLNRRVYLKGASPSAPFVMVAEGFAHGIWSPDYGCQEPRYYGPDYAGLKTITTNSILRVCVSARRQDDSTVPVGLYVTGTPGIRGDTFTNPQLRVGNGMWPIGTDQQVGDLYCQRRGDVGMSSGTNTCTFGSYARYNPILGTISVAPVRGDVCNPIRATVTCNVPVSPFL